MAYRHAGRVTVDRFEKTDDPRGGGSFVGVVVFLVIGFFVLKGCFGG